MFKSIGCKTATLFSGFALCAAAAYSPLASAQDDTQVTLEEIVVTAQKRSQVLAEIPMSVTVLGGETIKRQQIFNFQDMVPLVPGLSIAGTSVGVNRITLRGLNTAGVASTIGIYLDEVPFGSSTGQANGAILSGDFDTFDMARVEVLRGPQGTLYGASSLGGVMKYVPNRPNTEKKEASLAGSVETVDEGDPGYDISGMVNLPVNDKFALRASAFHRSDDGFVDSIGNNPIALPSTVPYDNYTRVAENINKVDSTGGRLQALFKFNENVSFNLMALAQDIENQETSSVDADPQTLKPLYGTLAQSSYHPDINDIEYRLYSGTLDWDFGGASLLSVTSYSTFLQDIQGDLDPNFAALFTGVLPLFGLSTGEPLGAMLLQNTSTEKLT